MQSLGKQRFELAAAHRQLGHGDAQAQLRVAGLRQTLARPIGRGLAFGLAVRAFDATRRHLPAAAEIDAEQLDATLFQRQQQARNHRIGHDETGQADPRRQAAQPSLDAGNAPGENLVHAAPATTAAGGFEILAPTSPGEVFAVVKSLGDLDAPDALQARRFHRRQRHALAIEQLGRRAGVPGDRLFPEIAFLHMTEEAARRRVRRNLAAEQRPRNQRIQHQRRRRTLQRAPRDGAARDLQVAMCATQVQGQPRRGAQHQRLRPAGQFDQRHEGQIGTDHRRPNTWRRP